MDLQQINIYPFSSASKQETLLMEIDNHFFEISKDTAELIEYLKNNGNDEESINRYIEIYNNKPTKDEIKNLLLSLENKLTRHEKNVVVNNKPFIYHKDFISKYSVRRVSDVLKFMFHPLLMAIVILVFITLELIFFSHSRNAEESLRINIYLVVGLYIFMALSSLIHEFGHASACRFYNLPHGNIGFGLYLNLPVFYTDVTHIWKLSRAQRFVVNFGGVYFQMILLIPILLTAIFIRNELLNYIILLMNINFTLTMNPFFKFDGYWIMTDLLGVANLRKKGYEWMGYLLSRIRGQDTKECSYIKLLSPWTKCGIIIYTVVVNLFFCVYFFYIIPQFFLDFYRTFPERLKQLLTELTYQQMPSWGNLQQIVLQLLFFFLFVYLVYKTVLSFIKKRQ